MFGTVLFRVAVFGESCFPELLPGKNYLASCLRSPHIGDYVVFQLSESTDGKNDYYVKKVKSIDGDTLHVGGTVSWSSSHILTTKNILATILKKQVAHTKAEKGLWTGSD